MTSSASTDLEACFGEGERLMAVVRERLKGVRGAG